MTTLNLATMFEAHELVLVSIPQGTFLGLLVDESEKVLRLAEPMMIVQTDNRSLQLVDLAIPASYMSIVGTYTIIYARDMHKRIIDQIRQNFEAAAVQRNSGIVLSKGITT